MTVGKVKLEITQHSKKHYSDNSDHSSSLAVQQTRVVVSACDPPDMNVYGDS